MGEEIWLFTGVIQRIADLMVGEVEPLDSCVMFVQYLLVIFCRCNIPYAEEDGNNFSFSEPKYL